MLLSRLFVLLAGVICALSVATGGAALYLTGAPLDISRLRTSTARISHSRSVPTIS